MRRVADIGRRIGVPALAAHAVVAVAFAARAHERAAVAISVRDPAGELLAWADARLPRGANVLLVTTDQTLAFRASHDLYPRPVTWGAPAPRVSDFDWHVPVALERDAFTAFVRARAITHVLVAGVDPELVPRVDGVTTLHRP